MSTPADITTIGANTATSTQAADDDDAKNNQDDKTTDASANELPLQVTSTNTTSITKMDQDNKEDNFWKSFVESIYSNDNLPVNIDAMQNVLIQIENCSEHILEHESEYESFYTSLISFCSLHLLETLNTCKKFSEIYFSFVLILLNYFSF